MNQGKLEVDACGEERGSGGGGGDGSYLSDVRNSVMTRTVR